MPFGCGTWPAFWSTGPTWPDDGEIDIIEGANTARRNTFSLHTSGECGVPGRILAQGGNPKTTDCNVEANDNSGCAVEAIGPFGYGQVLNDFKGGTYIMEWTATNIRMWFFRGGDEPPSIASGNSPDPAQFGKPMANFEGAGTVDGACDFDAHFKDHRIILNTAFCGDYGGNMYEASGCPMTEGLNGYDSCMDYVAKHPGAFKEAYWDINFLKVFQLKTQGKTNAAQDKALAFPAPKAANAATLDRDGPAKSSEADDAHPDEQAKSSEADDAHPDEQSKSFKADDAHPDEQSKSAHTHQEHPNTHDLSIGNAPKEHSASELPCDSTHTAPSNSLYHTYCDATVDGSTITTLQTPNITHCIAECDSHGKQPHPCTGVVYSPSTTTCELRRTTWEENTGVRPGMAMLHPSAGSFTALRLDVRCDGDEASDGGDAEDAHG